MKQGIKNGMKLGNIDQMQVFATINNVRIKINVGVHGKNELIKEDVIKSLFGIVATVNVIVLIL